MSTEFLKPLERSISLPRLKAYARPGDSEAQTLARYMWNASLCEAVYSPIQYMEIGLRNAIHSAAAAHLGVPDWVSQAATMATPILLPRELQAVNEARRELIDNNDQTTEGYIVAALKFSFWTSLLDSRYDKLWHKIVGDVFPFVPRKNRSRPFISPIVNRIRKLRNAASHHHSIWHWGDLIQRHHEIHTTLEWICPRLALIALQVDRFPAVLKAGPSMHLSMVEAIMPPPTNAAASISATPATHIKWITVDPPAPKSVELKQTEG